MVQIYLIDIKEDREFIARIFAEKIIIKRKLNEIHIDGGTRNCQICLVDKQKKKIIVKRRSGALTNNELEYLALIYALEYIKNNYSNVPVLISSDSQLIVNQINGKWRITTEHLISLYEKAIKKMRVDIKLNWIRRNRNLAGIYLEKGKLDLAGY